MEYIAHIRQADGQVQTVKDHLQEVRTDCERYGAKIGASHLAGLAGWLHDVGKNTIAFKNYIQEAAAHPETPPRRGSVDHSTAGGRLLYRRFHQRAASFDDKLVAEWIGNCIISHHQGLRDFLDPESASPFLERVARKELKEYEQAEAAFFDNVAETEFEQYVVQAKAELRELMSLIQQYGLPPITSSLLIKYLFSCLIDADRTNTRRFEEGTGPEPEMDRASFFRKSYQALMDKMAELDRAADADHPINRLRREMSRQCDEFAARPSGIYTLSIPTGGGKTLASLRYALKHALTYGKERIIYIVPYTTIIEQNAREIRDIIRYDEMILEHHSNVIEDIDPEDEDYDFRKKQLKLAKDNWDRPILFTTMVQFLNTFYTGGTRNVRRLHRLANAVLIFDEVQSVPVKCVSLFNAALNFLHVFGRSSIVLCTATQPALHYVKHKLHLPEQAEMIADLDEVSRRFKRVELVDYTSPGGWSADQLSAFVWEKLIDVRNVLVILNTKTAARKLFVQLEGEAKRRGDDVRLFHLSTNMCAAHRTDVLDEVKRSLAAEQRTVCVSTQLIEAGVNISFECVVRSLAGLDSIAQAAGRCNRHGKDALRQVYIIRSADEVLTRLPEIRIGAKQTERLLYEFKQEPERYGHDLLSKAAMNAYFEYYYSQIKEELLYRIPQIGKHMFDLLDKNKDFYEFYRRKHRKAPEVLSRAAFATAERYFEVIDNPARSVVVPYDEQARDLILDLNGEMSPSKLGELLRKLQPYVVNLFNYEFQKLEENGCIYPLMHGHILALREVAYSRQFGVETEGEGEWSMAMI